MLTLILVSLLQQAPAPAVTPEDPGKDAGAEGLDADACRRAARHRRYRLTLDPGTAVAGPDDPASLGDPFVQLLGDAKKLDFRDARGQAREGERQGTDAGGSRAGGGAAARSAGGQRDGRGPRRTRGPAPSLRARRVDLVDRAAPASDNRGRDELSPLLHTMRIPYSQCRRNVTIRCPTPIHLACPIDWIIVVGYIAWLVWDGVKRTTLERTTESYFLASRSLPVVGGRPLGDGDAVERHHAGRHHRPGLQRRPALHPVLHRPADRDAACCRSRWCRSSTRHASTRRTSISSGASTSRRERFTSLLFLLSRGMSCGAVVAAPAVVLSVILGWDVTLTALAICVPAVIYTILGGVQAVTWTDVKVMGLTVFVLIAAVVVLIVELPADTTTGDALRLAGAVGRLDAFDFRFSLTETYTIWSGLIGGLFLMLSYFGCDQSQVQRYLTARSLDQARSSLFMTAYWKIPLQILVLIVGVLTYSFYVFHRPADALQPRARAHGKSRAHRRRSTRRWRRTSSARSTAASRPRQAVGRRGAIAGSGRASRPAATRFASASARFARHHEPGA